MTSLHAWLPPRPVPAPARPTGKAALLTRLAVERAAWDALIAEIPVAWRTAAVLPDRWSVKDVIAHIAAYEQWTWAQMAAASAGTVPRAHDLYGVDALPGVAATWSVDQQNAFIHDLYVATPLAEVMTFAARAFTDLVAAVGTVSEAELGRLGAHAWTGPARLLDVIPAQTYEHYQQHLPDVRAVVAGVAPLALAGREERHSLLSRAH